LASHHLVGCPLASPQSAACGNSHSRVPSEVYYVGLAPEGT
jgi:hypothetical protein